MSDVPCIYEPRGGAKALFECRDAEVLLCGPAGTGKSRALLEKVHALCLLHPGLRALLLRKTRRSLTESVLVTFERDVVPPGSKLLQGPDRAHRTRYELPFGSEIVLGGLDEPAKLMSGEFDLACIFEATEVSESDIEMVASRLRNGRWRDKHTGAPIHQLLMDCNPAHPSHWLKRRCDTGRTTYIASKHADNPACTPEYVERLSQLTGVRRRRLYLGEWAAAEHAVFPEFDLVLHVVPRFSIPADWPRYRAVDFGYRDPFVCLWVAVEPGPDGRLIVYRELYETGRLVEDVAREIIAMSEGEAIRATVCDPADKEGRATLERRGILTAPARKDVLLGIQAVSARLRRRADGLPRLQVFEDALVRRDPVLAAAGKPCCLIDEFPSLEWQPPSNDAALVKEMPAPGGDHALDALRYIIFGLDARPDAPAGSSQVMTRVPTYRLKDFRTPSGKVPW